MNENRHSDEQSNLADPHDRLIDLALAETIGRETPPNLTEQILAAVSNSTPERRSLRARRIALLAVAASLILAIPLILTPDSLRQARDRTAIADRKLLRQTSPVSTNKQQSHRFDRLGDDAIRPSLAGEKSERGNEGREMELVAQAASATSRPTETTYELVQSTTQPTPPYTSQLSPLSPEGFYSDYGRTVETSAARAPAGDLLALATGPRPGIIANTSGFNTLDDVKLRFDGPAIKTPTSGLADGSGPQSSGDQYTRIYENPFVKAVGGDAVSTFSIDVDTASYANVRQFLMDMRQLPPPDAVRIEELVNYFHYDYAGPAANDKAPFAAHVEVAGCPWAPEHRLVRIGIKGREIAREKRPPSNLVFLVDVSGSMDEPNKLPLVVDGLRQLTRELGENDRVAIVVYASTEGLALESTRGDNQAVILAALEHLQAGGSTAGGAGIQLAYQIAEDHFIRGGTNRVVLCTDGDFNVGVTSTADLERLVTQKAKDTKVFLSVLGFGRGNLNDAMMQTIADRGNGNHHYVDNLREARKVLVEEMTGTLITIAKDVKIQVEFNPAQAAGYRLLGYENRLLRTEDFNDDTKDAGEIGAGHTVTALYEVIPAGKPVGVPPVDKLKYQASENAGRTILSVNTEAAGMEGAALEEKKEGEKLDKIVHTTEAASGELLTLKMRFKEPEGDTSRKLEWPVTDAGTSFGEATDDFRFAAAVASFGLELRGSEYRGDASLDATAEIAQSSLGRDEGGYRTEFIELVRRAKELAPQH